MVYGVGVATSVSSDLLALLLAILLVRAHEHGGVFHDIIGSNRAFIYDGSTINTEVQK